MNKNKNIATIYHDSHHQLKIIISYFTKVAKNFTDLKLIKKLNYYLINLNVNNKWYYLKKQKKNNIAFLKTTAIYLKFNLTIHFLKDKK